MQLCCTPSLEHKVHVNCQIETLLLSLFEEALGKACPNGAERLIEPSSVAVADAADPWFARLKEVIGPFHWTPAEALALKDPAAQARSVICWSVPLAESVRVAGRAQKDVPAKAWVLAKRQADGVLAYMANGLVARLEGQGQAAVAPAALPQNVAEERPGVGWSSCWSMRHVAFVAGLGTFGISGGLITRRGMAHRLGCVVTAAEITPTPRVYGDAPFAWCLYTARGTCGTCISRCPAGSVGQGHDRRDKLACRQQNRRIRLDSLNLYGEEGLYGCGLCQVGVPCEAGVPEGLRDGPAPAGSER